VQVQTVLQSEKDMAALLGSGHNFERWIKHGSGTDDLVNNGPDFEEPPQGHSILCYLYFVRLTVLVISIVAKVTTSCAIYTMLDSDSWSFPFLSVPSRVCDRANSCRFVCVRLNSPNQWQLHAASLPPLPSNSIQFIE